MDGIQIHQGFEDFGRVDGKSLQLFVGVVWKLEIPSTPTTSADNDSGWRIKKTVFAKCNGLGVEKKENSALPSVAFNFWMIICFTKTFKPLLIWGHLNAA